MANLGTALIRQDSLRGLQSRRSTQIHLTASIPEPPELPTVSDSHAGKHRVSKERGQRILEEALRKRSEPFPAEFAKTFEGLKLDASIDGDVKNTPHSVTTSSVTAAENGSSTTTTSDSEAIATSQPRQKKKRQSQRPSSSSKLDEGPAAPTLSRSLHVREIAPMRPTSLLIASLGNPPPYHSTRHSAAHIILKHLQASLNLPPFTQKSRPYGGGHVSVGADIGRPEVTLWQSPSLMNVSGPPLLKAWKNFINVQSASPNDPITGLIVLHDEMETEAGKVKAKRGATSPRGHNGIKSVQASFQGAGLMEGLGNRYVKIGIGIGRPTSGSRDTKDVSAYVLGQLTPREKDGLENATGDLINIIYQEMARMGQGAP